jgi:hypothetical protein
VWIIGRVQTNGPGDYGFVHSIQDGMSITPLRETPQQEIDPDHDTTSDPLAVVNGMSAVEFFGYAAHALALNPPHRTDFSVLARISRLGIVPGRPFDPSHFTADETALLQDAATSALQDMIASVPKIGTGSNGWTTFGDAVAGYGNRYFPRAVVALAGLGANPVEDAVYRLLVTDADGDPVVGDRNYVLRFDAGQLPPVAAFWSVTMYDGRASRSPTSSADSPSATATPSSTAPTVH